MSLHSPILDEIGRMTLPELLKLDHHIKQQIRSKSIDADKAEFERAVSGAKPGVSCQSRQTAPPDPLP